MLRPLLLPLLAVAALSAADAPVRGQFEGRPSLVLDSGAVELHVLPKGAAMVSFTLKDDPSRMNPLWNPIMLGRATGQNNFGSSLGHFVCVDGFGPTSKEELAAGFEGHGEAHRQDYTVKSFSKSGGLTTLTIAAPLPIVHENFTRTHKVVDGENVVLIESQLENLLGFDRPINWAEHATIGWPFLEAGKTVVDMSATRARTRPHEAGDSMPHRLPLAGTEFTWPNAPLASGGAVNVRAAPAEPRSGDHTTSVMDESRRLVFVTALHPEKHLLLGYLFRREDFPWTQVWEYYPSKEQLARGMEFSTQPFDVSRRDAISEGKMMGVPTYRWLPAKSTIESKFLMFYTRVPDGFTKVDDVTLEGGALRIVDKSAGKTVTLKTRHTL